MAKKSKRRIMKHPFVTGLVVVIIAVGLGLYLHNHNSKPKTSPMPTATIHQLPAQPAANNGEKEATAGSGTNKGTATDTHGQATPTNNPSQWLTSESGAITVKQPVSGSTIKYGASLIGSTTVSGNVQYRLIDNQVGVISEGFISVVNGDFSANINFQSHGSSGRLDVFNTDSNGGPEMNEVQVPVNF